MPLNMTPVALIFEDSSAASTAAEAMAQNQVGQMMYSPSAATSGSRSNERMPLVEKETKTGPPKMPFTRALAIGETSRDGEQQRLPQTIAHRGYKAVYPENTICAFKAAVRVGARAIETDLHLSKDGVVVLSHDGTLKRCFGIDKKINECTWEYLSTLRTLRQPPEPMPRLSDLLEYLATPEAEHIWVLLDVKTDDDPEELLTLTKQTIERAGLARCRRTGEVRQWRDRIVLGGWNEQYVTLVTQILPGFGASHIGFNLSYARRFLKVPNVSFNMLQKVLVGPFGCRFIKDVQDANRPLFVWTVNEEEWMEWSIRRKVDGVITDNPKLFLEICRRWEDGSEGSDIKSPPGDGGMKIKSIQGTSLSRKMKLYAEVAWIQVLAFVLGYFFLNFRRPTKKRVRTLG